jgi:hypothetical protein
MLLAHLLSMGPIVIIVVSCLRGRMPLLTCQEFFIAILLGSVADVDVVSATHASAVPCKTSWSSLQ